ncbi:MAG: flagellar filament capping protein FliD, partial [Lachnospiraceae bacterium]|nr:flagellar filament capping protein FliD [Lachnospiraceae bacterium]
CLSRGLVYVYNRQVLTANSNYELQFNIGDTDTNQTIQNRLARLINHSNLGLNASVITNDQNESALMIRSNKTGTTAGGQQPFMISDENTSQRKGIIDYLGIRETDSPAQNARYTVNGESFQSPSNSFILDGKYNITLKGIGGTEYDPVKIGVKPDYESLKDNIISLTGSYNDFLQAAAKYVDQHPRTNILIGTMKAMSASYASSFTKAGIIQDSSGNLSVDEEKLTTALGSNDAEETLGSLKNFTHTTLRKATQIQLNPMDYIDKRIVAYKNPNVSHFANPYVTSAYSGMLFNGYM